MLHITLIDDSELQLEITRQIVEDCLEQCSLAGEVSCFSAGMDLYKAVKQGTCLICSYDAKTDRSPARLPDAPVRLCRVCGGGRGEHHRRPFRRTA